MLATFETTPATARGISPPYILFEP